MSEPGITTGYVLQITVDEFDLILTILGIAGVAFAAWLYRHERWFRDIVFPLVQVLTGKTPSGNDIPSRESILEETDDRLGSVEEEVHTVSENLEQFARDQKTHNRKTTRILIQIAEHVEEVDEDDLPGRGDFLRGGNSVSSSNNNSEDEDGRSVFPDGSGDPQAGGGN